MPVESNSSDILQNGQHQTDFFHQFSRVSEHQFLRASVIRSAIHRELFACAFLG